MSQAAYNNQQWSNYRTATFICGRCNRSGIHQRPPRWRLHRKASQMHFHRGMMQAGVATAHDIAEFRRLLGELHRVGIWTGLSLDGNYQ